MISKSSPKIAVIGSSNTDLVATCPRFPQPGETILGGEFNQFAGGKGANQAVAAARAGSRVLFIGAHGSDSFGKEAKANLSRENINLRYFYRKPNCNSGIASILVGGKTKENSIVVAKSANDLLTPQDVLNAKSSLKNCLIILAQLEIPLETVQAVAALAQELAIPFILNPAPARKLPVSFLKKINYLTPNEHEILTITQKKSIPEAVAYLQKQGCQHILITKGSKGMIGFSQNEKFEIKAPKVKPVDTVGAGDCFNGWLATGLAQGLSLRKAASLAIKAASISVTRPGAQPSMPQENEVSG